MSIFDSLIKNISGEHVQLIPENDEGYVEYKLRLDKKNSLGLKKISSQMNWRLESGYELLGRKEAHYVLGVTDDGTIGGLSEKEIDDTFEIFYNIVKNNNATMTHFDKKQYGNFFIIYAIIKKIEKKKITEINIAFIGPAQNGKTTTISRLAYGQKDNGEGHARRLVFKHDHEKVFGITSSIKKEIIGIKGNNIINYCAGIETSWENIVGVSDKIVNLIDLPGNIKYIKTLLFGLSAYNIDAICIVINMLKIKIKEHDSIRFFINICHILKIQYTILIINDSDKIDHEVDVSYIYAQNHIKISNLTNLGNDELNQFILNIERSVKTDILCDCSFFNTIQTYSVPDTTTIFSGIVRCGSFSINQEVTILNGKNIQKAHIVSIYKKQINSESLFEGETGTIQLNKTVISPDDKQKHTIFVKDINIDPTTCVNCLFFKELSKWNYIDGQADMNITLFVGNHIIPVHMCSTYAEKETVGQLFSLMIDNCMLIEKDIFKNLYAFLKTSNDIYFGLITFQ